MPRSGGGIYSKGSPSAVSGTTIQSAAYNTTIDDLVTDANAPRPVSAGGTGAANAADARTSLGAAAIAGDTFTGPVFVSTAVATGSFFGGSSAGSPRWTWGRNGVAETGSNAGSDWSLFRYSDTATFLGTSLNISRATGVATFEVTPTVNGNAIYHAGNVNLYRNRIVNPVMQISQERGTTLVDVTNGNVYTVDQWVAGLSTTPGGTLRAQQVASVTPAGSPFRLRHTVQVADASIAAGDIYTISQSIEGQMIADARFGTASARQIVIRFGVRSSIAGTFGVRLTNNANNRSYVTTIVIAGGEINTDLVRTIVIPGDTSGTWLTDTGVGLALQITLAAGTTFQGTAGSWQGSNITTTSAQTNFMGTASATFELFDVGLYVDALAIGVAPPFEVPDFADELRKCQRYYETFSTTEMFWSIDATNLQSYAFGVPFRVAKRTGTPSVALANNMTGFNAPTVSLANASGFRVSAACNVTATARVFSFGAIATDRF